MRLVVKIGCIFLITCFNSQLFAQEYKIDDFDETYTESVNVSGSILASVLVSNPKTNPSPRDLFVGIPPNYKEFYLRLKSIDGRYSAKMIVKNNQLKEKLNWTNIVFNSRHEEIWNKYKPFELVANAFVVEKADNDIVFTVFPTSWGLPVANEYNLIVNSGVRSAKYTFTNLKGEKQTRVCDLISEDSKRAFDMKCLISNKDMHNLTSIVINTAPGATGKLYKIWVP